MIFGEALRLSVAAERAAYLDQACAGDLALRQEVESLLSAHAQAGDFLDQTRSLPAPDFLIERTGTMIGRYKLLEKIGEGGFGVVYMAEQEEPVQRKVALKIIKAGHGHQGGHRPVRGRAAGAGADGSSRTSPASWMPAPPKPAGPTSSWNWSTAFPSPTTATANKLSTAERLQLFMKVCHAVQHAHQKGIIHRDLKPTNVLVTLHDGEPVPKVIDFGVAKALGQKLTEKTLFTALSADDRHAGLHEPGAGGVERAGRGHAQRHLFAGRAALRIADGRDAVRRGDAGAKPRSTKCGG